MGKRSWLLRYNDYVKINGRPSLEDFLKRHPKRDLWIWLTSSPIPDPTYRPPFKHDLKWLHQQTSIPSSFPQGDHLSRFNRNDTTARTVRVAFETNRKKH